TEYKLPDYTFPYRANFDKNGELWASTMHTDRVVRLDPKTGAVVQYLMPSDTNMRTVFVDNSTTPVTFWVGSNHDHRLVQVEPRACLSANGSCAASGNARTVITRKTGRAAYELVHQPQDGQGARSRFAADAARARRRGDRIRGCLPRLLTAGFG